MTLELRPNEYVKLEAHFSFKVFVMPMLFMCIGIFMLLAVWSGAVPNERIQWMGHYYTLAGVFLAISGILFLPYIYKRTDNKLKIYAVTNQRVYVRRGIINIREKDIPLAKINDVQISQSFVQRMFNAGDIIIQVGNDESSMIIDDINRPRSFRDTIISAIYEAVAEHEAMARLNRQRQQQNEYNDQDGYQNGYNNNDYQDY